MCFFFKRLIPSTYILVYTNYRFKLSKFNKKSIIHKGKYENLQEAYAYAVNYVKEKGYSISGPIREVYIHGCWDEGNEDNYLTEIQIPFVK